MIPMQRPTVSGQRHSPGAGAWALRIGTLLAAIIVGALAGVLGTVPWAIMLAAVVVAALALLFFLGGRQGEKVLALYWVTFCLFSTMLTAYVVGGMFVYFYLALMVVLVGQLSRRSVDIDTTAAWAFVSLFVVVFASLIGYLGSLGGVSLDRLLFIPLGLVSMLVIGPGRTPRLLFGAMIASSLAVAVWVVISAIEAGFAYRGNVSIDQNVVSYFIGIGFVLCLAWFVDQPPQRPSAFLAVLCLLILLGLGYGLVLLASRGAFTSLGIVIVVTIVHSVRSEPRRVWNLALLLLIVSSGLLLPGGQGILKRFEDPSTETGGGRVLIWETVLEATQASTPPQLLFGHGMTSSAQLIRSRFTYLSSTHNSYLLMFYDYGLVGLFLFLFLHAVVFVRVWRRQDAMASQVLLLLVFQMSIGLFISASDSYLYWIALGTTLGATSVSRGSSRDDASNAPALGRG